MVRMEREFQRPASGPSMGNLVACTPSPPRTVIGDTIYPIDICRPGYVKGRMLQAYAIFIARSLRRSFSHRIDRRTGQIPELLLLQTFATAVNPVIAKQHKLV
jgi:hypothetical protein